MYYRVFKSIILCAVMVFPMVCMGQFHTVGKAVERKQQFHKMNTLIPDNKEDSKGPQSLEPYDLVTDSIPERPAVYFQKEAVRKKHLDFRKKATSDTSLPELTISNLLAEIKKCGIKHEKIVLAQAILETGWFTSPVCRKKHNLFGLTNPRTKQYYEFDHWTESVKAYYTKVQYRYNGGNYLVWLKKIGYAEDPRYISSLCALLRKHIL